jgi:biopolymer transport protein ExbB
MIVLSWWVSITKFNYLNSIQKGTDLFLKDWTKFSPKLSTLNLTDEEGIKTLGGTLSRATLRFVKKSPVYHLYLIGYEEIGHRLSSSGKPVLSARSMQAIKAALNSGITHEGHNMNNGLILLTISIAGGPYIGLLGTVVGVMITFAEIAKSGEVEVAAIAPGIASALLATTVGLVVAIPALFNYSYLNNRIKLLLSSMTVFVDEFITKTAEIYPEESASPAPPSAPAPQAPSAPPAPSRPVSFGSGMMPGTAPAAPAE